MTHTLKRALLSLLALIALSVAALAGDPGTPIADSSEASDQKAGALLVYNAYTSDAANPATVDTRINITNTNQIFGVSVHLFFLRGTDCNVADSFLCLTENQTATFRMSDLDPGVSGYIIAVATNSAGLPIRHNFLIGDLYVKYATGHAANLGAIAFSKLTDANVLSTDGSLAGLFLDGLNLAGSYNRAPKVLAVDNIPSRVDGNDTLLILNNISGSLVAGVGAIGTVFGIIYNDVETPYSFSFSGGSCQFRNSINSPTPFRTSPAINSIIPGGRSGWIRLQPAGALVGAAINRNTTATGFNGGHNLHHLTLTQQANLVIPILGSNCPDTDPN
jgi:hypothetical protein